MQVSNVQSETQRRTWVRGVSRWVAPLGILALMPVLMGLGGCPCGDDADCVEGDFCEEGVCVDCRDNADCSEELPVCVDNFCEECGEAADCDDGNACTTDTCDENNECVRDALTCDDGDACTTDSCDEATGCVFAEIDCDDGEFCNGEETCQPDAETGEPTCVAGIAPCDEGETCDEESGVCFTSCTDDTECDDGDVCNGVETCDIESGDCQLGTAIECNVGEICDSTTGNCMVDPCFGVACGEGESCNPATGACGNGDGTPAQFDVLQFDNFFYPTGMFRCGADEDPQEPSESCPEGAGCDEHHWHSGMVAAIASVTGVPDVSDFTIDDPNPCKCGQGKVSEVTRTLITLDASELAAYLSATELDELPAAGACPP